MAGREVKGVCDGQGSPTGVTEALAMLGRALDHLNAADMASLPTSVQADALRALGQAQAKQTAARARGLGAFAAQGGCEEDGHGTARTWLKWQTRITTGAAAGAIGWVRRLAAHPVIEQALAAGELSPSWARRLCEWTERLPGAQRGDADEILVGAARGGAGLTALAGLAQGMYERSYRDGDPPEARYEDRWFQLGSTFGGAGRAEGDLTPGCAAALAAVLEALGKKAGPEDPRTRWQRRHDALEEACRRLIRAGMVPARAGQPTQVLVHMTLGQLRGLPGGSAAEGTWAAARASQPGWVPGPDAEAAACDATVVPVVTGHVDWTALDRLVEAFLASTSPADAPRPGNPPPKTVRRRAGTSARWRSAGRSRGPRGGQRPRQPPHHPPRGTNRRAGHRRAAHPRAPAAQPGHPRPAAPGAARPRRRRALRPRRAGRPAPRRPGRRPAQHRQPAAGHRRRHRNHPRPPAPGGHHPPPAPR